MEFPGGTPERVTNEEVVEFGPAWSPDGEWLAYTTWSDVTGEGHIQRVRARPGSRPERLTPVPALYQDLAYSLDGARIVATRSSAESYLDDTSRGASEFVWVPASGGELTYMSGTRGL